MLSDDIDRFQYVYCNEVPYSTDLINVFSTETNNINILQQNIRSYTKNFDDFLINVQAMKIKFDIIVLTETWHCDGAAIAPLDGFDVIATNQKRNRNDGTIIFVSKSLSVESREVALGDVYGLTLDWTCDNRQFKLLALYRTHDSDIDAFLDNLEDYCGTISKNSTNIIVGDLNLNILNTDNKGERYLNILTESGYVSCIDKPTRVTVDSMTCIDHGFIKHANYDQVRAAVIHSHTTDHYSTALQIRLDPKHELSHTYNYLDRPTFTSLLRNLDWQPVLQANDVNESASNFNSILQTILKNSYKPHRHHNRLNKLKPWISTSLIRCIRKRDKLSKLVARQPFNVERKNYFKAYRNRLTSLIKFQKQQYYRQKINDCKDNPRKFWGVLNEIAGRNKLRDKFPIDKYTKKSSSEINEKVLLEVADDFNQYFSTVGQNLASRIAPGGSLVVDDQNYITDSVFQLTRVTEVDILRHINSLRGGSAPGCDGIPTSLVKENSELFVEPIMHIVNLSIVSGVFPSIFKIAKVYPLYKSSDATNKTNYRPISLLSVFSKIIEKVVKEQLCYYLEQNSILTDLQYGFRKDRNINDALFNINKDINNLINNNKRGLLAFLDLAKAFDSLDRNKLIRKLDLVGVRGKALEWFSSYLAERRQIVAVNNVESTALPIDYGVVQGSNLGPILFLIYINNLAKINITGKLYLFADDTAILFDGSDWEEVTESATRDLSLVKRWFDQNSLTVNVSKTKFLPIALRSNLNTNIERLKLHTCDLNTNHCQCESISKVNSHRYLGIVFNSSMNWSAHVDYLKSKVRKFIFVFRQLHDILNLSELRLCYYAYCQSLFMGGIIAWGGGYRSVLEPLNVIQNSIIKAALGKGRRYPTHALFNEFKVFNLRQLFVRTLLIYIHRNSENIFAHYNHNYNTRSSHTSRIFTDRLFRTFSVTNSFYISQILYRNSPPHLKNIQSLELFKKKVSEWLVYLGRDTTEAVIVSSYR
jgi:hypothetical protein